MKFTKFSNAKINTELKTLTPRFRRQQDNFFYWSAQVKPFLKARRVWNVVEGDDGETSSASHKDGTDGREDGAGAIVDTEFTKDVACSVIF